MKMTYYKLKDILATYGIGFYFSVHRIEFVKDNRMGELRKAYNGYTVIFSDDDGNITEQYRLIMEPRNNYCYLFGIVQEERADNSLVKKSFLSFDDEAGKYDFKYTEENPLAKEIIYADYCQPKDSEECSSTVEYSLSEIYENEGFIRIKTGRLSCEMGIHKNKPGEKEEPIYGWFNGVFQSEAPAVVESSEQLKKIMGVLSPDLLENFEKKISEELHQKQL